MAAQYELSLQDYWRVIRKRRWVIIPTFVIVFMATLTYSYLLPTVFEASASVQYTEQKPFLATLTELVSYPIGDTMLSQAKVASSWSVMDITARDMGFVKPDTKVEEAQKIISRLQQSVTASIEKDTNIIKITVLSSNGKEARNIANAVAEGYKKFNLAEKSKTVTQLRQTIEKRLTDSKQSLDKAEENLRLFKENNPGVTGGANSIYANFEEAKKQRDLLASKFTAKHPEVIKLNNLIDNYRKELARYPEKELGYSQLSREMTLYDSIYTELRQRLERAHLDEAEKTSDVSIVNIASIPPAPVYPNKTKNQIIGIMLGLVIGIVLGFLVENLDTSIATIEEIEALLKIPVLGVIPFLSRAGRAHEKKKPFDIFTWLFGPSSKKHRSQDGQSKGEEPLSEHSMDIRSQLIFNYSPTSPITEAYKTLRTNLLRITGAKADSGVQTTTTETISAQGLVSNGKKGQIIIITSTGPEEGKTVTAINLSISMAQKGEMVLLVDTDIRKSVVHKVFGLEREPGLSDILMGKTPVDQAIRNITDALMGGLNWDMIVKTPGIDNLNIMTSGASVPNPAELLSSIEVDSLFAKLREKYSYIILDCPPVLPVTDAMILGPKSDIITMVYRAGRTEKAALLRAKEQLTTAQIKISGLILNHISPEIEISPTYYYHYYKDYSSSKKK
ncbi:MAG: polysaccharide biosynthesis tyrosine autokinase [Planctomycetota bacterium]